MIVEWLVNIAPPPHSYGVTWLIMLMMMIIIIIIMSS